MGIPQMYRKWYICIYAVSDNINISSVKQSKIIKSQLLEKNVWIMMLDCTYYYVPDLLSGS